MSITLTLNRDFEAVEVVMPDNVYELIADDCRHGAAWLDEHRPGWAERVHPDVLDMEQACACVCGQVFCAEALAAHDADRTVPDNGYDFAKHLAGYRADNDPRGSKGLNWAIRHGFSTDEKIAWIEEARPKTEAEEEAPGAWRAWAIRKAATWVALDHAWRPLIERRAAAALPVAPA